MAELNNGKSTYPNAPRNEAGAPLDTSTLTISHDVGIETHGDVSPRRSVREPAASATAPPPRPPGLLLGVPVTDVDMHEALDLIAALIADGRRRGLTHQLATVNVDFVVNALEDPELHDILRQSTCLADGAPLKWLPSLFGTPVRARVAGSELLPDLMARALRDNWRVHIFGSSPTVSERARAKMLATWPGVDLTTDSGPQLNARGDVDDHVIDELAALDADIICVALGNPKQEYFIRRHAAKIGAPVMIGVGGTLDMYVGDRRQAGHLARAIGLEWVVRAVQEPRRLGKRYAHDVARFVPRLVRESVAVALRRRWNGLDVTSTDRGVRVRIDGKSMPGPETYALVAERLASGEELEIITPSGRRPRDDAASWVLGWTSIASSVGGAVSFAGDIGSLAMALDQLRVKLPLDVRASLSAVR